MIPLDELQLQRSLQFSLIVSLKYVADNGKQPKREDEKVEKAGRVKAKGHSGFQLRAWVFGCPPKLCSDLQVKKAFGMTAFGTEGKVTMPKARPLSQALLRAAQSRGEALGLSEGCRSRDGTKASSCQQFMG